MPSHPNKEYLEHCLKQLSSEKLEKTANARNESLISATVRSLAFSLIVPNYETWLDECLTSRNWQGLNDLIYQNLRHSLLPGCSSGYDHSRHFESVLAAIACGDTETVARVLPHELGPSSNGYPFYIAAANLFMALWYHDDKMLETAIPKAEKFAASKKPQWERSAVLFLLCLHSHDMEAAAEHLLMVCKAYMRTDSGAAYKRLCISAHGLYCLAWLLLPEDAFSQLKTPEYKNFSPALAQWRLDNPTPAPNLYFRYPEPLELLNQIYNAPAAISRLHQPYLNSTNPAHSAQLKKTWFLDEESMLHDFAATIRS